MSFGLIVFARPELIETKSHSFLVAQVRASLAERTWFTQDSGDYTKAEQALADACDFCSPRRPLFASDNAPSPTKIALRAYSGALQDLLTGILYLLAINLTFLFLAATAGLPWVPARPCATRLSCLVVAAELGGSLAYLFAPAPLHFLILRSPFELAVGCGLVLAVFVLGYALIRKARPRMLAAQVYASEQPAGEANDS